MVLPNILAYIQGGEEIAETAHAHVIASCTAPEVAHCTRRFTHSCFPGGATIACAIDGTCVGGKLSIIGT
ncbi:MAG: Uncharacterised protein [Prochlorococcus marinus str. MIT 9313]|nr:MAG: Uncharacterised protein [Prochlorococcus marinus str. MIT 9313]